MSVDSIEQYTQAVLGRYNDHHRRSWPGWSWTNRDRRSGRHARFHLAMLRIGLWAIAEERADAACGLRG
jgi:hypothetical protein